MLETIVTFPEIKYAFCLVDGRRAGKQMQGIQTKTGKTQKAPNVPNHEEETWGNRTGAKHEHTAKRGNTREPNATGEHRERGAGETIQVWHNQSQQQETGRRQEVKRANTYTGHDFKVKQELISLKSKQVKKSVRNMNKTSSKQYEL